MFGIILTNRNIFRKDASTITEHINSFSVFSTHRIVEWNIFLSPLPASLLNHCDFLIFHYSIFGTDDYKFSQGFLTKLNSSKVIKIAFFQDEYLNMPKRLNFINSAGIDIIYTLLHEDYFYVYTQKSNVSRVIQTLTGFVDKKNYESLLKNRKHFSERPIDVSYRARRLPFYMGKGAQEKAYIADQFTKQVGSQNLSLDISCDESDRLYGSEWNELLCNSKFTLSVEAGVSVFDTSGTIKSAIDQYLSHNPNATFEKVYDLYLKEIDGKIHYRTISPRFFEAAAAGVVPIMFPGEYNGLLKPDENYICLEKDFSNISEVIKSMGDANVTQKIIDNNDDIINNNRDITYQNFIRNFDNELKIFIENDRVNFLEVHYGKEIHAILKPLVWWRLAWLYVRFGQWPYRRKVVPLFKKLIHFFKNGKSRTNEL